MLSVQNVNAGYGVSQVLFDVSIGVNAGEVVTLLGRNGMGKTTTILSIMGVLPLRSGEIFFDGKRVSGWPSFRVARLGLGTRPRGPSGLSQSHREREYRGHGVQSGSIRAAMDLRFGPGAVSAAGRARRQHGGPSFRRRAADARDRTRARDQSSLVDPGRGNGGAFTDEPRGDMEGLGATEGGGPVDSHRRQAHPVAGQLADYHYVLEKGCVAWRGTSQSLRSDPELLNRHLSV